MAEARATECWYPSGPNPLEIWAACPGTVGVPWGSAIAAAVGAVATDLRGLHARSFVVRLSANVCRTPGKTWQKLVYTDGIHNTTMSSAATC